MGSCGSLWIFADPFGCFFLEEFFALIGAVCAYFCCISFCVLERLLVALDVDLVLLLWSSVVGLLLFVVFGDFFFFFFLCCTLYYTLI